MQKAIIDSTIEIVNLQNENKKLKEEIKRTYMQNNILEKEMMVVMLDNENKELKGNLDFYKSIFKTHPNSAVFNLRIKSRGGKLLWIDKVIDIIDNKHRFVYDMGFTKVTEHYNSKGEKINE